MIRRARPDELETILEIRRIVFIEGQSVPVHEERDGLDGQAIHLIAFDEGRPVGTARLLIHDGYGKIGRVAVLEDVRGKGYGKAIMQKSLEVLREEGAPAARLAAQIHAVGFYEALGFEAYGDPFLDAGILHRNMTMTL